jgi:hypothetical protein
MIKYLKILSYGGNMNKDNQQPSFVFKQLKEDKDYLIYSDGSLFSNKTHRFLTGKIDNMGYRVYAIAINDNLSVSGKKLSKMVYAHRLVAEYFLDNPNNLPYVHHKDENKLNNNVENLEWISPSDNTLEHIKKNSNKKRKSPRYFIENLEGEEWLVVQDNYNYSVSNCGRVKNNNTNRLLHLDEHQRYSRVQLGKKHYYIHRLVYCTFYNDYELEGYVIDHIDANPRNNNLSNLQKITQQENCLRQKRFND